MDAVRAATATMVESAHISAPKSIASPFELPYVIGDCSDFHGCYRTTTAGSCQSELAPQTAGMSRDEGVPERFSDAPLFGPTSTPPASRDRVVRRSAIPYAKPRILHNRLSESLR